MIQAIINFFRKPQPAPIPLSEQVYEIALDAVRAEMDRKPGRENPAAQMTFEEFREMRRKRPAHRPRKYHFHDIEIGETCRAPIKAQGAVWNYSHRTGKKFTTRARNNGLWIKRVA